GACGDYCGARMQGGTIAMLGACGARPGFSMRRGTLLFAGPAPAPGPTFNDAGELPLGFLVLLARSWKELPSRFASLSRPSTRVRRSVGGLAFSGQGEPNHSPGQAGAASCRSRCPEAEATMGAVAPAGLDR